MKRWVNILSQVALGSGQLYTLWEPHIPSDSKVWISSAIVFGQILISAIAHEFNPDGTPSEVSYQKKGN